MEGLAPLERSHSVRIHRPAGVRLAGLTAKGLVLLEKSHSVYIQANRDVLALEWTLMGSTMEGSVPLYMHMIDNVPLFCFAPSQWFWSGHDGHDGWWMMFSCRYCHGTLIFTYFYLYSAYYIIRS